MIPILSIADQARLDQHDMDYAIRAAIVAFETKTGLAVIGVDVRRQSHIGNAGTMLYTLSTDVALR